MDLEYRNIYRKARDRTRLTQEGWAERLDVSVDAVKKYESGKMLPSDDIVLAMAGIINDNHLAYEHLQMKSRIAEKILPDLGERTTLPKAVLNLIVSIKAVESSALDELIQLTADGKITMDEEYAFANCLIQLENLSKSIFNVKYAKEDP